MTTAKRCQVNPAKRRATNRRRPVGSETCVEDAIAAPAELADCEGAELI
jgi:hypothetical protein